MRKICEAGIILIATLSIVFVISVPSYGEETIYGCVKQNSGQLRIVDHPNQCKSSEDLIAWGTIPNLTIPNFYSISCQNVQQCSCGTDDMLISGGASCANTGEYLMESKLISWPWGGTWMAICVDKNGNPLPPYSISIVCLRP